LGQRINIQYTIEIDELEEEVRRLIYKNVSNFETILGKINDSQEGGILTHKTLEDLDLIRQEMAKVDLTMLDCVNIIDGYLQYKSRSESEPFPNGLLEPDHAIADELSNLKDKIGKFKEAAADEVSN
jgi:hypothetical protein